jgi:hypothetical protein
LLVALGAGAMGIHACAAGGDPPFEDDNGGGGQGASGGGGGAGGEGGQPGPCAIDCSTIMTDECHEAICDAASGQCAVVPVTNGVECDDGLFCTVDDACQEGVCTGGGQNDCGIGAAVCHDVVCDEAAMTCTQTPVTNGTMCQPADLCTVGGTCTNGICSGGFYNDCFFAPVPNLCHVAVCNPATGDCEAQPGNEGMACVDGADLCSVGNTCSAGVCGGGSPKDCTHLTQGCFDGECDMTTGQCAAIPIPAGGVCAAATDDCNVGMCDALGDCVPTPANEGGACDMDGCFLGQTCAMGACQGGTQILTCIDGDNCCPAGCDLTNDDDCGCHFALISDETQFTDDATVTNLLTANGHTFDILANNSSGTHSGNAATVNAYETIIYYEHDRTISAAESTNLTNFVNNGGRLLVTGYDSLGSPTDTLLATLVRCNSPADGPFADQLSVVNDTHPIMLGPAASFTIGTLLTASSTDHDTCLPAAGSTKLIDISGSAKLIVTDNVGVGLGKVIYWNGNGYAGALTDWTGAGGSQPQLQNLFINVIDHLCQ